VAVAVGEGGGHRMLVVDVVSPANVVSVIYHLPLFRAASQIRECAPIHSRSRIISKDKLTFVINFF